MPLLSFEGSPHGGRQRHLPEWQSQPRITPTTIIDHSIVGSAEGAWQGFAGGSGLESHFIVDLGGEIWQLMDTGREADANLHANRFAISIETADNGHPDTFEWTRAQLESLAWLHNKLVAVHPTIPRRLCPSEAGGGLGYHTLFGAPSAWTPVAKTCPGAVRKRQWREVLLPTFLSGTIPEDDMALSDEDKQWLKDDLIRLVRLFTSGDAGNSHYPATNPDVQPVIAAPATKDLGGQLKQALELLAGPLPVTLTDDQLQDLAERLAPLVAGLITIEGHPAMTGTVNLTPAAPGG